MSRISVVIFEGGASEDPLVRAMTDVRKQVVLDNIEKALGVKEIAEVILATNYPDLSIAAGKMGATVEMTGRDFHFGDRLKAIINRYQVESVIYMGGAAAPLITPGDFKELALGLREERVAYVNNLQSTDIIAFSPANAVNLLDPPVSDNLLGWLLKEEGFEQRLLPASTRVNFDLDTPTDMIILSLQADVGPRTKKAVMGLNWSSQRILAARDRLMVPMSEIILIGRIAPGIVAFINKHFQCRLRVFSEERGMKALGREASGEVVSFLGFFLEELGPKVFFDYLSRVGHAAFIDSRVLVAHLKGAVSDNDRYNSDLMRPDVIEDPDIREFTMAAMDCPIPVVLGGHSLVQGGLWLLAEGLLKREAQPLK